MPLAALAAGLPPSLWLQPVRRTELCLGAFQRAASALRPHDLPVSRRLSGGPCLLLSPDTLHLLLTLPSPSALAPDADPPRLLNRYVRPLLRGLSRLGVTASYTGQDWVGALLCPTPASPPSRCSIAWVGFAHHAASGACCFEAFLPLSTPLALPPGLDGYPPRQAPARPSLGLSQAAGRPLSCSEVSDAILAAYDRAYGSPLPRASWSSSRLRPDDPDPRPPWSSLRPEAIGFVGASLSPTPELGGDFFASDDLIAAIHVALLDLPHPSRDQLRDLLARAASDSGGILEGVRSIDSLLDVLSP